MKKTNSEQHYMVKHKIARMIKVSLLSVFILPLIQNVAIAQQSVHQSLNKVSDYHNSVYRFKIQYSGKLTERSTNEVVVELPQFDSSKIERSYVTISVDQQPFVDLSGTYGGRYYFNQKSNAQVLSHRYATEQDTVSGFAFTKEYWLVYGGMGSWDAIINAYTKYENHYYIISLTHSFLTEKPGEVIDGRKISEHELINKGLELMHNEKNKYVDAFNSILSSFSIGK